MSRPGAWDRLASDYALRSGLFPAEQTLVDRLGARLGAMDVLDVGIGAGRTTEVLTPLVRSYVGIDYSPRMIEAARHRVLSRESVSLKVADARDLSLWHGRDFDLVLFSFNGIDAVDVEDRMLVLQEIRKVVSADGVFAFSTHSLNALPLSARLRRPELRDPIRSTFRSLRRVVRIAALNRRLDLAAARKRGWVRIRDGAHDFTLVLTYVDPEYQLQQLVDCGFDVNELLDSAGRRLDPSSPGVEPHLFYVCLPRGGSRTP